MSICRKVIAASAVVAIGIVGTAEVASAGKPAEQACLGQTFSLAATTDGGVGTGIRVFAQDPTNRPGLGDGIQFVQAGLVPDGVVPNFCN